jgi:hypothetical protein
MGRTIIATTKLKSKSFHAVWKVPTVKFLIKVPITSAGIKMLFSSFERIPAAFFGTAPSFVTVNPIIIRAKRNTICSSVEIKRSMVLTSI